MNINKNDISNSVKLIQDNIISLITAPTASGKSIGVSTELAKEIEAGESVLVAVPTISTTLSLYDTAKEHYPNIYPGYAADRDINYTFGVNKLIYATSGHVRRRLENMFSSGGEFIEDEIANLHKIRYLIVDEIHIGSIDNTIIIGIWKVLLKLSEENPQYHLPSLVLMSATISGLDKLGIILTNIPIYSFTTKRKFETQIKYLSNDTNDYDVNKIAAKLALEYHYSNLNDLDNHIIIFVSGIAAIKLVEDIILPDSRGKYVRIPFHSLLKVNKIYELLVDSPNRRKIIISTNALESGITVPNVGLIIDTMYEKTAHESATQTTNLTIERISKNSADQRAGRTGRTRNGVVIRCCTKEMYNQFVQAKNPDVMLLPIYKELISVTSHGLDVFVVFGATSDGKIINFPLKKKIERSIEFIGKIGVIEQNAQFISDIKLDLRPSIFLYDWINNRLEKTNNLVTDDFYVGIVLANLINYNPASYGKSDSFTKLDIVNIDNDLITLYGMWQNLMESTDYQSYRREKEYEVKKWCNSNSFLYEGIFTLCVNIRECLSYMKKRKFITKLKIAQAAKSEIIKDSMIKNIDEATVILMDVYKDLILKGHPNGKYQKDHNTYINAKAGLPRPVKSTTDIIAIIVDDTKNNSSLKKIYIKIPVIGQKTKAIRHKPQKKKMVMKLDQIENIENKIDLNIKLSWDDFFSRVSKDPRKLAEIKTYFPYLSCDQEKCDYLLQIYELYKTTEKSDSKYGSGENRQVKTDNKFKILESAYEGFDINSDVRYLDIGSGDGLLAKTIARNFGIEDYYLSDVQNNLIDVDSNNGKFILFEDDQNIKLDDVGLVSIFQALHHAKNVIFRIENIANLLPSGGVLLISDHDSSNGYIRNKILLEHIAYELGELENRNMSFEEFVNWFETYDLNLMTKDWLHKNIINNEFTLLGTTEPSKKNSTYYSIFIKD